MKISKVDCGSIILVGEADQLLEKDYYMFFPSGRAFQSDSFFRDMQSLLKEGKITWLSIIARSGKINILFMGAPSPTEQKDALRSIGVKEEVVWIKFLKKSPIGEHDLLLQRPWHWMV